MANHLNPRRKIWMMECRTIWLIIGTSFDREGMVKLCGKLHPIKDVEAIPDHKIHDMLHLQLHHKCPFSKKAQDHLNRKYSTMIELIEKLSIEDIHRLWKEKNPGLRGNLPGFIWAVASDSRGQMRWVEKEVISELHQEGYRLIGNGSNSESVKVEVSHENPFLEEKIETLSLRLEYTRKGIAKLREERDGISRKMGNIEAEKDRLRRENKHLLEEVAKLSSIPSEEKKLKRELKKLNYEVKRLTSLLKAKEDESRKLGNLLAQKDKERGELATQVSAWKERIWMGKYPTPFRGERVVLIGGLEKLNGGYKNVVESLGAKYEYHPGAVSNGRKHLTEAVKRSDIVVCFTAHISHSAIDWVKKLCKKSNKPLHLLQHSGVSQFKNRLQEIAPFGNR